MILIYPNARVAFDLKKNQDYYVPVKPVVDYATGEVIRPVILSTVRRTQLVTHKKGPNQSRRTVSPGKIDQSRPVIKRNSSRYRTYDTIVFPNRRVAFRLYHGRTYQIPIKKKQMKDVVYTKERKFLTVLPHPRLKVKYTIPFSQLDQSRDIVQT